MFPSAAGPGPAAGCRKVSLGRIADDPFSIDAAGRWPQAPRDGDIIIKININIISAGEGKDDPGCGGAG